MRTNTCVAFMFKIETDKYTTNSERCRHLLAETMSYEWNNLF